MKSLVKNFIQSDLYFLLIIFFFIIPICNSCDVSENTNLEKKEISENTVAQQNVLNMASKYNAILDWKKKLLDLNRYVYTIDFEEIFIRDDHRPILFFASVQDIKKEQEKYQVHFYFDIYSDLEAFLFINFSGIRFFLECSQDQIDKIKSQKTEFFNDCFAVVANVSKVEKASFRVFSDYESEEIEIGSSYLYLARGICLDLEFVGESFNLDSTEIQQTLKDNQ